MKENLESSGIQTAVTKKEGITFMECNVPGISLEAQYVSETQGAPRVLELTEFQVEEGVSPRQLQEVLVAFLSSAAEFSVKKIQINSVEALAWLKFASKDKFDFSVGESELQKEGGVASLDINLLLDALETSEDNPFPKAA